RTLSSDWSTSSRRFVVYKPQHKTSSQRQHKHETQSSMVSPVELSRPHDLAATCRCLPELVNCRINAVRGSHRKCAPWTPRCLHRLGTPNSLHLLARNSASSLTRPCRRRRKVGSECTR